jgi:hypothetical protein
MTTVGFGSGSFSNSNPRFNRGKKRKQLRVRNSLLESLETRHLMAAGPQLIGAQPNEGSTIALGATGANATVLNTSPREIVLRFDDTSAIDLNSLAGIQIKRAGADGILDSAYLSTDLGTQGQVVLDFSASLPGQQGNGLELRFTQAARSTSIPGKPASWPLLSVDGNRINIEVNVQAGAKTTADDLLRAFEDPTNAAVSSRVLVKRLRGIAATVIADTVPVGQIVTLQGADSARVSSNLNSGNNNLQVEFLSTRPGVTAQVEIISQDFGGPATPTVVVTGQLVRVTVNSNARNLTTVKELVDAINSSADAKQVLQARIISGSPTGRIGANFPVATRLNLVAGDDVRITPAYIGYGDSDREIVIRFSETLPDDFYLIDLLGSGPFALRNTSGLPFNGGVNQSVRFDLDLGTRVEAVVPQPTVRAANGTLSQLRNQIYVYFNADDLNPVEATKVGYYQVVYTRNSVSGADDLVFTPSSVSYDATLHRSTLVFNRNLDALTDGNNQLLPISTLRLRLGNTESPNGSTVTVIDQEGITNPTGTDSGSRFDSATNLGGAWLTGAGPKAAIINAKIENSTSNPYKLDYPGSNNELGNRDNQYQHHVTRVDTDGIAVISYNFAAQLGTANNSVQLNTIVTSEAQRTMVRQVLSQYERYLGVRFVESDNLGITIAVGDMQAIDPLTSLTTVEANGPGGLTYAAGPLRSNPSQSAVIIDSQDFNSSDQNVFGSELFRSFMRGIGVLLGLGNADELPQSTVQNNAPITDPKVEQVFPGNADIIHGQNVLRPESKDIDLYRFAIPGQGGKLELQVSAERLADSSLLDASLRLYRNEGSPTSPKWVEVAANEDYFSKDPRISLDFVRGGDYIIGVSAKGNTSYDPSIEDSGIGGKSEGKYQLRIDYRPPAPSTLVDVNGTPTPLDGNGDGKPGGVFNYWFVPTRPDRSIAIPNQVDATAYTVWVDKTAAAGGNGTLATPYNTIAQALQDANAAARADTANTRAVTVRILGNTSNRVYEVGFNQFGNALADGSSFDVPKNVTVMIDAGAIIKMGRSRISAGSSTVSVDRSGGSLQVLGIPGQNVIITSINEPVGVGFNPDRSPPAPRPGDWGGIDFRNRIDGGDETRTDKERNGLFLNSVIHSDVRYGGGQVVVDGVSQIITPINLVDSRPSIFNNLITRSADAAISATPNSFKEDNFADPRSQSGGFFIPDYDRVGPEIHGNTVINNTINGLFIKTRTSVADTLETITVTARFDDIDIPHVLGENLVVAGQPGGGIVDVAAPPTTIVTLTTVTGGSLAAGTYNYRLVYVDAAGNESLASIPTRSATVVANSSISLNNLPPIGGGLPYVARRLYRSDATGAGTYRLVTQLNAIATSYVDNGTSSGSPLVPLATKIRSRLDGGLVIDAGTILKNTGNRIELRDGATLIAEGTSSLPIILTSLNDIRYGFGGTFDTAGTKGTRTANLGDWGGIFVGPGSSASLDYDRISFGGGNSRIEGVFASFNAIEVHQGDLRLSNSRIENNASGAQTPSGTRAGRGTNTAAAIFVSGSQPVLLNNRINDNGAAAISIDVNSFGPDLVNDPGRQSGNLARALDYLENQGPLINGNRLSRNATNGLVVRGQTLTTQAVWDDTDIVHVVTDTIVSDNFHTYGGLRLKSSPTASLVVKFGGGGSAAGLTATGTPLDISNRVGGSVQIIGQPNFPVVLTAIADDSVGAGFGIDGRSAFDTNNDNGGNSTTSTIVLPTGPELDRGLLIDNDVNRNTPGFFAFLPTAGGDANFRGGGGITAQGTSGLLINQDVIFDFLNFIDLGANGNAFRLSSTTITRQPTLVSPDLVVSEGTFVGNNNNTVRWRVESRFENGVAKLFNTLILDSDAPLGEVNFINYLDEDIGSPIDDFLYVTGNPGQDDFRAFTIDSRERVGFSHGGVYQQGVDLQNATYTGWAADQYRDLQNTITSTGTTYTPAGNINTTNLPVSSDPTLGQIYGNADVTTAFAWRIDPNSQNARITSFLELVPTAIQRQASPGSWNGVALQTYSNDRNVAVVSERESARASAPSTNGTPASSQYLGQIAKQATGGDENARLGFEIQGALNKPSDVDVYSFTANGRTEVWLDIDRTTSSLDTVVELVSADGSILALSNDSYLEETEPLTNPLFSTLSGSSVNPLRKNALSQVATTVRGEARDDYSTNPKDAGLRVLLPGRENEATLYHVRVRSSNQFPGQPAATPALTDPASVGQGRSRGSYQLQIRLGETQELPGSSVSYADIRFAQNGITLSGVPRHSPLVGETSEIATRANDSFATAQELGNILQSDRQTISVAGSLTSPTDVDWYTFTINYQSLLTPLAQYLSTVFDVDYADGIGRADMSMYLYDATGRLVQFGENSNILDDRATAVRGADNTDLSRGSTGTLDPFIGSVELQAGRYFVALTNRNQVPAVLANRLDRNQVNNDASLRIQPVNSGRYIVEDRIGDRIGVSGAGPITPSFLPASSRVEYVLADVPLYLSRDAGVSRTDVFLANSFTGQLTNQVGSNNEDLRDIAIRPNGDLRSFRSLESGGGDANALYVNINSGTATTSVDGAFNNTSYSLTGPTFDITAQNAGLNFEALTYADVFGGERGYLSANRGLSGAGSGVQYSSNIIYQFNPNTGAGFPNIAPNTTNGNNIITGGNPNPPDIISGAGTSVQEIGFIDTTATGVSGSFAVTEATSVRLGTTNFLIFDGDSVTVRQGNTSITFEFNAGPQLLLNFAPQALPPRVLAQGDQFTLDGQIYQIETNDSAPPIPGIRFVRYRTDMTNDQFVTSLRNAVPSTIEVGYDGNRVNFKGVIAGNFATLVAKGVATDLGTTGSVGSGRISVDFLAQDTATDIANRLADAISNAGFPGLSAVANGNLVNVVGGRAFSTVGSSRVVGISPGGTITGLATVNGDLYGVSDQGGLFRVSNSSLGTTSTNNIGTFVGTSFALAGLNFTGLTAGPRNVAGGQYANLLFGTTFNGDIFAFNTRGELQNVFVNGQSRISTGVSGLNGLAFSNLDYNLFHQTQRRNLDVGHGINRPNDLSDIPQNGGTSWYFGFDGSARTNASYTSGTNPLTSPRSGGEALNGTYNFPGGASGVLESQAFSLSGMTTQDAPNLYFNYFLSTDDGSSNGNGLMTDSFRVYGAGDNGVWVPLTTNNSDIREATVERTINNIPNSTTAPATAWRQARVDLSSLVGSSNVKLRFEFSTAGSMGYGTFGGKGFELRTVPGSELVDGQTFTVNGVPFEIDLGTNVAVPSGAGITNGDSIQVRANIFSFWDGTGTAPIGNIVRYTATDSPETVAQSLKSALQLAIFAGPNPPTFVLLGNRIVISGATVTTPANSPFVVSGADGVRTINKQVQISADMTPAQVARQVADAFERELAGGIDAFTTYTSRDRFIDITGLTVTDAGPFSVSTPRAEDAFSENGQVGLPGATRAQNNAFEGLYLDDFIIGLAERGETVTGNRIDTNFVTRTTAGSGILVGPYQLEIRGGTDYGQAQVASSVIPISLNRAFEPNQQQGRSQTIRFNGAAQIADGQTMVISDGLSSITFEFDDLALLPNSPSRGVRSGNFPVLYNSAIGESAKVIASRVRDILNSPAVQSVLKIAAISADGSVTGQNSDTLSLIGTISASVPTSVGLSSSSVFSGDSNTPREQGQIIVENSHISNSLGFGITLQADPRDPVSGAPNPGSVRNTITLNNQRLIPGAVVQNNELRNNIAGGINIVGDTATGDVAAAPVPFARIVNNTILGGSVATVNVPPAATFGDDFYSLGSISFADAVTRYDATLGGGPVPITGLQIPGNAIGAPNYTGIGEPIAGQGVVSLGRGGVLVVQFTNNILTGSNDARPDLAVYEVGSSELVTVEVSSDNVTYTSVGTASFANRYVDLDAFGFNSLSQLFYVRLTDVASDGAVSGDSVGADIDAVGAISSRPGVIFTPSGTGISVTSGASPTLLNNIVSNHSVGVNIDASSSSTVAGATLFQGNSLNTAGVATLGQFPIIVPNTVPLFNDVVTGNLNPLPGSPAIDSTIDSLVDRSALLAVKQPLGLAASPIIAPSTDINGLLRVDDPNVATPPGLGEGIFKDRGAADRSDFVGPTAIALNPIDNDAQGQDSNPSLGTVELVNKTLTYFDIQLIDASLIGNQPQGTGVDQRSVTSSSVLLYRNSNILVEGLDYRFGFDSTSNVVRLTPLSGLWDSDSVYQIRFININQSAIQLVDPKSLVDGTIYTVLDKNNNSTRFELDTGIRIRIPASINGFTNTVVDGTIFRIDDGTQRITFEFDSNSTVRSGNVAIAYSQQDPPSDLAEKIANAIRQTPLNTTLRANGIGGGELQILSDRSVQVLPEDSRLGATGQTGTTPGYGLRIPTQNGLPAGITDGQSFTIQRGNTTVVFELDSNGTVRAGSVRVPISTASTTVLANSIVTAINGSTLGITASVVASGLISVGNQADVRIQATSTVLQVVGVPGRPASIAIPIDLSRILTSAQVASLITDAITAANLPGVTVTQLGSSVLVEGALGVAGLGTVQVTGIRDLAGNAMRATELNGQTLITIFLGQGLDYGDAADPKYASKKSSGGPTHVVVQGFSLGPTVTSDPDARLIDGDQDDGVSGISFTAAFTGSFTVDVRGASTTQVAFVSAWIDVNANGIFEASEKIVERAYFSDGPRQITLGAVARDARTDVPVVLRVRMSTQQGLTSIGSAPDGEVEDYYVTVNANPYTNPTNFLDVNADGFVSPIDVLQLVNYINTTGGGRLPFPSTTAAPPYLDVNGDGSVDALDVLTVINYINTRGPGGSGEGGGEGEGSGQDAWVSAAGLATPPITSKSNRNESAKSESSATVAKTTTRDDYLASVSSDVGPALATDELDWDSIMPALDDHPNDTNSAAVSLAIEDLLMQWS